MYYCTLLNRLVGPFTQEEIYELIRRGEITKSTPIQCHSETKSADEWPEFHVLFSIHTSSNVETQSRETKPLCEPYTQPTFLSLLRGYCFLYPILSTITLIFLFSGFSNPNRFESRSWGYGVSYSENQGLGVEDIHQRDTAVFIIILVTIVENIWLITGAIQIPSRPKNGLSIITLCMFTMPIIEILLSPQLLDKLPGPQVSDEFALLYGLLSYGSLILNIITILYWLVVSHKLPKKVQIN